MNSESTSRRGESLKQAAKGIGTGVVGVLVLCVLVLLPFIVFRGMVWASEKMMPWLVWASAIAFLVGIFILLPMCIFRASRPWAGLGYLFASYVFGVMLWAYSCLFVVYAWGYVALAIGLVLAGVGVVPVAILAAIFHGEWSVLGQILFSIALTFGTRVLGAWLSTAES